jgi:hypothetical protein
MCTTDGGAEVWSQREQRARKGYECYECGRLIPAGERYVYTFSIQDGDTQTYRTHVACEDLRDFIRDVACGGRGYIPMAGLYEEIREAGDYLDVVDEDAWEEAGLDPPNPFLEVFDFIQASYPAYEPAVTP